MIQLQLIFQLILIKKTTKKEIKNLIRKQFYFENLRVGRERERQYESKKQIYFQLHY